MEKHPSALAVGRAKESCETFVSFQRIASPLARTIRLDIAGSQALSRWVGSKAMKPLIHNAGNQLDQLAQIRGD